MWVVFNIIRYRFLWSKFISESTTISSLNRPPILPLYNIWGWRETKNSLEIGFLSSQIKIRLPPYHIGKTCCPKPFRTQEFNRNNQNMVTFDPAGAGTLIPTDRFLNRPVLWLTALRPSVSPWGSAKTTSHSQWLTITGCNKGTLCSSCRHKDM